MSGSATLEQLKDSHQRHVARNQQLPVAEYPSKSKKVEAVFEVTDGVKYVPGADGQVALAPGRRFRPTELALKSGALKGKARELTASEMTGVKGGKVFAGADIGARKDLAEIPMAESTRERAFKCSLVPADFVGIDPAGAEGQYTRTQVDEISQAKQSQKS